MSVHSPTFRWGSYHSTYASAMNTQPSSKGRQAADPDNLCLSYQTGNSILASTPVGSVQRDRTALLKRQPPGSSPAPELKQTFSTLAPSTADSTRVAEPKRCECLDILRLQQLTRTIGLSRSTIYGLLDPGSSQFDSEFPRPIRLGTSRRGAIGWFKAEVLQWLRSRERLLPH